MDKMVNLISPFLQTDLVIKTQQTPGVVLFENYEQLKSSIQQGVAYYRDFTYTLDTYQTALNHRRELKYVKNVLEKTKREIVKSYNEPLAMVEKRIEELINMVKVPFKKVDTFIKENERNAKKYEIYIYAENLAKINGLCNHTEHVIRSSAFFDSKWLNASRSGARWRKEVLIKIKKAVQDISYIESLQSDKTDSILAYYYQTLSMEKVEAFIASLEKIAKPKDVEEQEEEEQEQAFIEQEEDLQEEIIADNSTEKVEGCELKDCEVLQYVADSINPYTGEMITGIDSALRMKLQEIAVEMEELKATILVRAKSNGHGNGKTMIGQKWTEEEEKELVEEYKQGLTIRNIAQIHQRKEGGIQARLKKLGLIE